jgi:hypothetical protein
VLDPYMRIRCSLAADWQTNNITMSAMTSRIADTQK